MTLHTCPDCAKAFKMRAKGRCPHCQTLLLIGREIYEVVLSRTIGWFWDGQGWINCRQLVGRRVLVS